MMEGQEIETHHIVPQKYGENNSLTNLMVLHQECHRQVTYTRDPTLKARFVNLGVIKHSQEQ